MKLSGRAFASHVKDPVFAPQNHEKQNNTFNNS